MRKLADIFGISDLITKNFSTKPAYLDFHIILKGPYKYGYIFGGAKLISITYPYDQIRSKL